MNQNALAQLGLNLDYVSSLPLSAQNIIMSLSDNEVNSSNSISFMSKAIKLSKFKVDDEFWSTLGKDDGVEVWSGGEQPYFLFSCTKFMKITSYTIGDLRGNSWDQLFERDEIHTRQLLGALQKAVTTGKIQNNVTPFHLVKEKMPGHDVSALVRVKAIAPFFVGDEKLPMGIIALTEFKQPS